MEVDPRDARLHDSLDGLDGIEDSLIDEPLCFTTKTKETSGIVNGDQSDR